MVTEDSLHVEDAQGDESLETADSFLRELAAIGNSGAAAASRHRRLEEGEVIAERFVIERFAGRGGMGAVYRALDRTTGEPVALKVMTDGACESERFAQEARLLAELAHPTIVRHVAHGTTAQGQAYLAMEWLDGEDVAKRLRRAGLGVADTLALARRVAQGLAVAHARGVVHRDIKPSNVMLADGDPARAKLLDFGVARAALGGLAQQERPITKSGVTVGTVGYMSPEQATGDRALDARTDVFALGCVLFECLTGVPAFSGAHVVAVLAKVLCEEAPRARDLRPELPSSVDELLAWMLSKDRSRRPADGAAVLLALEALGAVAGGAPPVGAHVSAGLSDAEQRRVCVMLAVLPDAGPLASDIVARHGGDLTRLADGSLLVTLGGRTTSEHLFEAAACALDLFAAFPSACIVLSTGRAQTTGKGPPGPVIDQAASLLMPSPVAGIRIDEVTAGLLGERFDIRDRDSVHTLVGRRTDLETPRTLLGKPTPCVGRDRELGLLEGTLRECVDDGVARAVLVTGPAGQGKSRLRYELVAKARARGDVAIFTARADPVGAGSAFLLARQLVRQAAELREGDPAGEQAARLRAHVARICEGRDAARIADFLGEIIGAPSPADPSPQLLAGRSEPRLMGEWLRRSFREWLTAECEARPLLVVLEDLHWGDVPSVTYLGDALRALSQKPFMLVALARPEVNETFRNLWANAERIDVVLGRLAPRAAQRLITHVLGDVAPDTVALIVERADGNAFYLEELIRRVSEGDGYALPETVLALVESRLDRLESEARLILRAASVFGEAFWRGGIAQLIGAAPGSADLAAWLDALADRELVAVVADARFPGEREYVFRHGLVREVAYAMLTDADRATGHRLAGEWLETVGEKDPLTMADHFDKGGEPRRATPWIVRAAEAAFDGGSSAAARALAERGIPHAEGEPLGILKAIQGAIAGTQNDLPCAIAASHEATTLLPRGGRHWLAAAATRAWFGALAGMTTPTLELAEAIANLPVGKARGGLYAWSVARVVSALLYIGQPAQGKAFLDRIEAAAVVQNENDRSFAGWLAGARWYWHLLGPSGDLAVLISSARAAVVDFEQISDALALANAHLWLAAGAYALGRHDEVEDAASRGLAAAEESGTSFTAQHLEIVLWADRVHTRDPAECSKALAVLAGDRTQNVAMQATLAIANLKLRSGDAAGAEVTARSALEALERSGTLKPLEFGALTLCARALGALRRPAESLAAAERAMAAPVRNLMFVSNADPEVSRAEALIALDRRDEARAALRATRDRILRTASILGDADRTAYLDGLGDNVRALTLAREWLP